MITLSLGIFGCATTPPPDNTEALQELTSPDLTSQREGVSTQDTTFPGTCVCAYVCSATGETFWGVSGAKAAQACVRARTDCRNSGCSSCTIDEFDMDPC